MEAKSKIRLTIDGNEATADQGMTILEAAQQNGIHIPTLCHHPALSNLGGCRMCVVAVEGVPRLVASCVMPVREGMSVVTSNERIIESRRTILEFIFAERNHNCMFCPQSGDCELQQLAYDLGMDHMTVPQAFKPFPVDVSNEHMGIDHNRCILCGRCVRACAELAGSHVLTFQNRGPRALIGLDLNETLEGSTCDACGVCLQVCPTGAIFNRHRTHYAVKGHTKSWHSTESHCPLCGLLCPTTMVVADNTLLKVEGRLMGVGDRPDRGQLCARGRFEVLNDRGERLRQPRVRSAQGRWSETSWEKALDLIAQKMNSVRDAHGGKALFGITSGSVSNEVLNSFRDLLIKGWSAGTVDTFDGPHYRTVLAAEGDSGNHCREASWKQLPEADVVIVCGDDLRRRQPLLASLLHRNVLEKGTRVAIIGPTDFMEPFTSFYLPTSNENFAASVDALWAMAAQASQSALDVDTNPKRARPTTAKQAGKDRQKKAGPHAEKQKIMTDLVRQYLAAKQPLVIAGEVLGAVQNATALSSLARLAQLKTQDSRSRLLILKRDGNSAGAWRLGIPAKNSSGSEARLKAGLILLGDESAADAATRAGNADLNFLAVISPYVPLGLLDKAHVLIPRPAWLEEAGTYTAADGNETAYVAKVLQAPDGVGDTWQTLLALAERAGYRPPAQNWEALTRKAAADLNLGL